MSSGNGLGRSAGMRRIYRDRENGIFLGVCAGIADAFEVRTIGVRALAVIALICAFWPVLLTYLVAGFLLRDRPLRYRGRSEESSFWRDGGRESWR